MTKQINNKYAMIILAVIIVLCGIFGFFILDISAYKSVNKKITDECKRLYIKNYEIEEENENLKKLNLKLREENVDLGKKLDKFLGE